MTLRLNSLLVTAGQVNLDGGATHLSANGELYVAAAISVGGNVGVPQRDEGECDVDGLGGGHSRLARKQ